MARPAPQFAFAPRFVRFAANMKFDPPSLVLLAVVALLWSCDRSWAGRGYNYKPPSRGGYFYPKPARLPPLPLPVNGSSSSASPPPGVQSDFIDDLIEGHKQQILSNVLGVASETPSDPVSSSSASQLQQQSASAPFPFSPSRAVVPRRSALIAVPAAVSLG